MADASKKKPTKQKPGKHPGGRPRLFKSPQVMQEKIESYFEECDNRTRQVVAKNGTIVTIKDPARYTVPGMAYYLGFISRTHFADYAKDFTEYTDTITRARARIEAQRASDLVEVDTRNANGIKFDLANNFGWQDKVEVDGGIDFRVKISVSTEGDIKI